jgi:low temperature requirement protein LtrA
MTTGTQQTTLARDVYSYLHFLMVAGIVLFALGLKKTLADVDGHLATVPATALTGGLALYLLAHVLLRLRISRLEGGRGSIGRGKPAALVALLVFSPLADDVPALVALAFTAAVFIALIAYEAIRYREPRALIRHGAVITEEMMAGPRLARRTDS